MTENDITVEAMRIRAEPPRVTRLSRKVLAGVALVGSLGIGGALIYALQAVNVSPSGDELYSTENRQPADGLASLPKDYTGPVLGPPLPGDLGRPILDAQDRGQAVASPSIVAPTVDEAEQRRQAEEEAARTSNVFFPGRSVATAPDEAVGTAASTVAGLDPGGETVQSRRLAFLNEAVDRRTMSPDRVLPPASPYILQAGAVIPAALITGIRSDLPGQIAAQVTQNVYDSPTGRSLLVPQGTRVVGQYDSGVGFSQRRVLLVWTRLIFPNGRSMVLERLPGVDAEGYAGLEDGVDHHWKDLFKAAALSTLLSIGAETGTSAGETDLVRALRQGASDSISQAGQQIVQRQLDLAPTLTIRPGFPVRVLVTRDLVLTPYEG